jgi:rod shape-determining protein MreC
LSAEVERLEQQLLRMDVVRRENERYAELLGTVRSLDFEQRPAFVVARQAVQFERTVTLDHGTESGISVDDPVLSPGGALVGVVTDVGPGFATAMLLSDTRSVVIGQDDQTRSTGEVRGRLEGALAMTNIPSVDAIAVGDTIVTANVSHFPRGLPIGTVIDVDDTGAVTKTALVQPIADLERLEAVIVVVALRRQGAGPLPDATRQPVGEEQASAGVEPERTRRPRARP